MIGTQRRAIRRTVTGTLVAGLVVLGSVAGVGTALAGTTGVAGHGNTASTADYKPGGGSSPVDPISDPGHGGH